MGIDQGRILKGIGGFYYVEASGQIVECRARGVFRKNMMTPLVGDFVEIEIDAAGKGIINNIFARKNSLIRPPVANIDKLFILASIDEPRPNLFVIDKLIAIAEYNKIVPIIIVTKSDLGESQDLYDIYRKAGLDVFCICAHNDNDHDILPIKQSMADCVSVFTGNSGVGKSTLLNRVDPNLHLPTGEISKKLSRGRHTTRHVELFLLDNGGYIADTPGFSSLDFERCQTILKDDLAACFREFAKYTRVCRFPDCAHIHEKQCGVIQALERGEIAPSRHQSYVTLYGEASKIKEWERP